MNQKDAATENQHGHQEHSPRQTIIDRDQENTSQADPTAKDSYDEFEERMRWLSRRISRFWHRKIRKGWRRTKFNDKVSVWIGLFGLGVLIVYTVATIEMYFATRDSADAAMAASKTTQQFEAAHLAIGDFEVGGPYNTEASFDIVNSGNSVATEITIAGSGDNYSITKNLMADVPEMKEHVRKIFEGAQPSAIYGFSLPQGAHHRFTFPVPADDKALWWRAYVVSYRTIFGEARSEPVCWNRLKPGFPVFRCPLD